MCSRKRPDLYTLAGGHVKRNQQQVSIEGQVVWRSVNVTQHDWWDRDLFMGSRSHDVSQKKVELHDHSSEEYKTTITENPHDIVLPNRTPFLYNRSKRLRTWRTSNGCFIFIFLSHLLSLGEDFYVFFLTAHVLFRCLMCRRLFFSHHTCIERLNAAFLSEPLFAACFVFRTIRWKH